MCPKTTKQFETIRQKSKETIVKSALELFSTTGYFNTSIRQIAKKANVSNGLLYNYFKSKEELVLEILHDAFKLLDESINDDVKLSAKDRLKKSIEDYVFMIQNKEDQIRMLAQMGLHRHKFELANNLTIKKYEESIEKLSYSLKELKTIDYKIEARIIAATLDGMMFESLLMPNSIPLEAMKNHLVEKYCNI